MPNEEETEHIECINKTILKQKRVKAKKMYYINTELIIHYQ